MTVSFRDLAERVLDALLESIPEAATALGDHRFDDRLGDLSPEGVAASAEVLGDALTALDQVEEADLDVEDAVDLEILRTTVAARRWELTELRAHEIDPLVHLPGDALYPLLGREIGDAEARLRALAARMTAVPRRLEVARRVLHDMPRVHVETAIVQTRGIAGMLGADLDTLLDRAPALRAEVLPARAAALDALAEHTRWLEAALPTSDGDPRLGERLYAARLWYTLDTETTPDVVLTRAESDLQAVEEEIAELASRIEKAPQRPGQVRDVLDRLAAAAPVDDSTVLALNEQALADVTRRVRELDLVTVPDDPVRIIEMPESRRGLAVAYCDPPGPLEPPGPAGPQPTLYAISPAPSDWSAERVASFYREYNGHMLRNLATHEGVPGHLLQLGHSARHRAGRPDAAPVRVALGSGTFIEGWAVYAESLIAGAGLGLGEDVDAGLRMHRLKTLLRTTINAILDVRIHSRGMTEAEAMSLLLGRGHQEEGEAVGKVRRALLTSAQLTTYHVGWHEVSDVVRRLRASRPGATDRELHDAVLANGSPSPRHLRRLLGLG
ncbi:MAG: DUF885 domain-containing protein [Actinomycetales bacterium]|nr:DUF885 domain-containing protein [Actinomycetales bacterium]